METVANRMESKISIVIQEVVRAMCDSNDTIEQADDDYFNIPCNQSELQSIELGDDEEKIHSKRRINEFVGTCKLKQRVIKDTCARGCTIARPSRAQ